MIWLTRKFRGEAEFGGSSQNKTPTKHAKTQDSQMILIIIDPVKWIVANNLFLLPSNIYSKKLILRLCMFFAQHRWKFFFDCYLMPAFSALNSFRTTGANSQHSLCACVFCKFETNVFSDLFLQGCLGPLVFWEFNISGLSAVSNSTHLDSTSRWRQKGVLMASQCGSEDSGLTVCWCHYKTSRHKNHFDILLG